eukprot:3708044-Amphidinium_carterae.1
MHFCEPSSLHNGKSVWYVFERVCRFAPLARRLGHTGLSLQHVVADRAQLSAIERALRWRHLAFYGETDLGDKAEMLQGKISS